MEMIINAEKVIAERKIRAWSQQHLADACAVSLRTIQRVENNGSGSLETIKSLASCFDLDVDMLFEPKTEVVNKKSKSKIKIKPKLVALFSFILALLSSVLFISPTSMASNIVIKADVATTNTNDGYTEYTNNVVIFLPKSVPHKVSVDSNWETNSSSTPSLNIKIYIDQSIISIDKASIVTTDNGTKITTEYAKFS